MQNKTLIAVRSVANQGKSSSIKMAYATLKKAYPNALINEIFIGVDITVVITINGVKIGIESQGDPHSRLFASLDHFVKIDCKVIVCATRSKGGTVEAVEALGSKYKIKWLSPNPAKGGEIEQNAANSYVARQIVAAIQDAL